MKFILTALLILGIYPGSLVAQTRNSFTDQFTRQLQDSIPSLASFTVWRKDAVRYEHYFHGTDATTSFNIKAITKSVVSAVAGIAQANGLLPDLNTRIMQFFPEFQEHIAPAVWFGDQLQSRDSLRRTVTLKDLLTMRAGWEWTEVGPLANAYVASSDPVRFALDLPYDRKPGAQFVYSSAAASVFSAALAKSIYQDLNAYSKKQLFDPTGMKPTRWDTDPKGRYTGASELYMTAGDLLRFGLLYLHGGKVGNQQVVPAAWVKASTDAQSTLDSYDIMPGANGYGYFWWRRISNGHQVWVASGTGGQMIAIIPDVETVIVATTLLDSRNRGRDEVRRLHWFVDMVVKDLPKAGRPVLRRALR